MPSPDSIPPRPMPTDDDIEMSVGQVAQLCRVSPNTVRQWINTGQLAAHRKPHTRIRSVRLAELKRFLTAKGKGAA